MSVVNPDEPECVVPPKHAKGEMPKPDLRVELTGLEHGEGIGARFGKRIAEQFFRRDVWSGPNVIG